MYTKRKDPKQVPRSPKNRPEHEARGMADAGMRARRNRSESGLFGLVLGVLEGFRGVRGV